MLFLGVARALKAMHQYRVKRGPGGVSAQKKARGVRREAEEADLDAARRVKQKRRKESTEEEEYVEQEPLMDGEVTRSQEGVEEGEIRAYAHRDVKPGPFPKSVCHSYPFFFIFLHLPINQPIPPPLFFLNLPD